MEMEKLRNGRLKFCIYFKNTANRTVEHLREREESKMTLSFLFRATGKMELLLFDTGTAPGTADLGKNGGLVWDVLSSVLHILKHSF